MDRLEDMIRESLQARSDDVEPTPALWDGVEHRVARRRWLTVGAWSLGTAVAALVAVVVVPGLLAQPVQPDIADTPPSGAVPTAEPTVPSTAPTEPPTPATEAPTAPVRPAMSGDADGDLLPDAYVALEDDGRLTVRDSLTDEVLRELRAGVELSDGSFEAVAVRPGSTVDDLVIAVSFLGEGFEEVRVLDYSGDREVVKVMGIREHDLVERPRRTLAWDELGEYLAWTFPDGIQVATLEDIRRARPLPGTAGNDVSHVFQLAGASHAQVTDWTWFGPAGELVGDGMIALADGDGWFPVTVDRAPDGTLASMSLGDRRDGPVGGSSHAWPEVGDGSPYLSLADVDGVLELSWSGDGDQRQVLPLGGDLAVTDRIWFEANYGGALVGKADGVWLSHTPYDPEDDAVARRLPDTIEHAAFLPVIRAEVEDAVATYP